MSDNPGSCPHDADYMCSFCFPNDPLDDVENDTAKTVVEYATTVAGEQLDDVILAYMKFAGPPPEYTGPVHFTLRQRIRIRKNRLNHAVQQWIHDHLPEAYCDN